MVTERPDLASRLAHLRMLVTDVDGVLTDGGVYYSADGEVLKRFSVRDGMGVQRLRELCGIETAIMTGEQSAPVIRRAQKLGIAEVHLLIADKAECLQSLAQRRQIPLSAIAFIGDDVNDRGAMQLAGVTGCPSDALPEVARNCDFVSTQRGGHGAFRDFAEWIISSR